MKHNLERIVDFLRLGRGNKRLLDRDAAYVMNVYLKDNLERDRIARGLGLGNRCGMCLNQCKGEAVSRHCPECRKGIIAWLEEEGETSL